MLRRACLSALLPSLLWCASPSPANAVRLDVPPIQAVPGQTIGACVVLSDNRDMVALQVDLAWDERCLFPTLAGTTHQCWTFPSTGKSILARLREGATRIVLIALNNPRPIPDGEVFCCSFDVAAPPPGTPCWLDLVGASGSDATGRRIGGIEAQGTLLSLPAGAADVPQPALPVAPSAPAVADAGLEIPVSEVHGPGAAATEDEREQVPATSSFVPPTPGRDSENPEAAAEPAPALPLRGSTPASMLTHSGSESEEEEMVQERGADPALEEEEPTAGLELGTPTRGSTPTQARTERPAGTPTPLPLRTTPANAPTEPAGTPTAPVR